MSMPLRARAHVLAAVAVLACAFAACDDPGPTRPGRVLLVGLDGASPKMVAPLLREGRLPNLGTLARDGAHGTIRASLPLFSPRIWTTVITGKEPHEHRIEGFSKAGPDGKQRMFQSSDRATHALWNIATNAGITSAVVNWWTTFPPERIRGVMVSDHLLPDAVERLEASLGVAPLPSAPTVHPEAWQARALELMRATDPIPGVRDPFAELGPLPSWTDPDRLRTQRDLDAGAVRVVLALDGEIHPEVTIVLLPGVDRVSHQLWGMVETAAPAPEQMKMSPEERDAGRAALRGYYEYADALIGRLLTRYDANDLVVVLSDHGFEAGLKTFRERTSDGAERVGYLTGTHGTESAQDGVLFARGPGIAPGSGTDGTTARDIMPTILAWLGLPLAQDMPGKVAAFLTPQEAPRAIATYDTEPIERIRVESRGGEAQMLENLRALGYMK